jgi:hypothetical protein
MSKVFFIILMISFYNCEQKAVPAWDAQSQINAAAEFKANQCLRDCQNSAPNQAGKDACFRILPFPPLLVLKDQIQRNLDLCSIAITRTNCPLNAYPLACIGVYTDEAIGDISPLINFNEFSKQKFSR